jgi:hypothetical protein
MKKLLSRVSLALGLATTCTGLWLVAMQLPLKPVDAADLTSGQGRLISVSRAPAGLFESMVLAKNASNFYDVTVAGADSTTDTLLIPADDAINAYHRLSPMVGSNVRYLHKGTELYAMVPAATGPMTRSVTDTNRGLGISVLEGQALRAGSYTSLMIGVAVTLLGLVLVFGGLRKARS